MPLELVSWLAALLVMAVVVVKMVTGHSVAAQRGELSRLDRERDAARQRLEQVRNQLGAAEDNLEFYQRRLLETQEEREELQGELAELEESIRRHLESLGYDEETIETALRTGQVPEGTFANDAPQPAPTRPADGGAVGSGAAEAQDAPAALDPAAAAGVAPAVGTPAPGAPGSASAAAAAEPVGQFRLTGAGLGPSGAVAVVPATLRDADKLFLPDAMVTELLGRGLQVLDRSVLIQRVRAAGEDLGSILDGEQYFRLGKAVELRALIVVNSRLRGSGIGSATCRVVELPSGRILLSTAYEQPGADERSPGFEPLTRTAHVLAEAVASLIRA